MRYRISDSSGRTVGYATDQGAEALGIVLVVGLAIVLLPIVLLLVGVMTYWSWATALVPITPFPNLNGILVTLALVALASASVASMDWLVRATYRRRLGFLVASGFNGAYSLFAQVALGLVAATIPLVALRWLFASASASQGLWPWTGGAFPARIFFPYLASLAGAAGSLVVWRWNQDNGMLWSHPGISAVFGLIAPWVGMNVVRLAGVPGARELTGEILLKWNVFGVLVGGFLFGCFVLPLTRFADQQGPVD